MWRLRDQLQRSEGQAVVILAVAMTAIIGLAATVLDVTATYVTRQRLQDVVDMASLAATQDLPDKVKAAATAISYVDRNTTDATASVSFPDAKRLRCRPNAP